MRHTPMLASYGLRRARGRLALLLFALVLAACGQPAATPSAAPTPAPATAPTAAAAATTDDYAQIIEASKSESGLLLYSNMSEQNFSGIREGFKAKYPWIAVESIDLTAFEAAERYNAEAASNARTADMIIGSAIDVWPALIEAGALVDYTSPEEGNLPDYGKLGPGIYTVATDPVGIIWNKALVTEPLTSFAAIAELVAANPEMYKGKLTTYDIETNSAGFAINWSWLAAKGEAGWETIEALGASAPVLQSSAGNMIDSVISGERLIGYFLISAPVQARFPEAEPVLGFALPSDGVPVMTRAMAITSQASSPNSAKLLLDYILSAEGQIAATNGGLTAYRSDVVESAAIHLEKLTSGISPDNLIITRLDPAAADQATKDEFLARWKAAVGKP
ncbi:MAG: ABC transporter substrate-binding protein [Chloroflexi bacterium OHK40]